MAHSTSPSARPAHSEHTAAGLAFGWLIFFFLAFTPRVMMLGFWIFSDLLSDAYSSWVIPVAGFFVLPSTTITYAMAWGLGSNGVHGAEWLMVAAGVLLDTAMWAIWARVRS